jgi:hypothetical protein
MKIEITQKVQAPADLDGLHDLTRELVGKACWSAKLGYGDELTLDLGGRVPRLPRSVPPKEKGEWVVRTRATPWTIEPALDDPPEHEVEALLRKIEGATITAVEIGYPDLSLEITFSNQYTLRLVPEPDEEEDADEDGLAYWEIFGPRDAVLEVGPGAVWSFSQDEGDAP